MRNYYDLHALQTNMADVCEEPSSDCSDSISVNNSSFHMGKVVAQKKICHTKNLVRILHPRESKTRSEESNSSSKRSANIILRKRQSKLRETVILASKAYLKITLLVKTPLQENRELASSG